MIFCTGDLDGQQEPGALLCEQRVEGFQEPMLDAGLSLGEFCLHAEGALHIDLLRANAISAFETDQGAWDAKRELRKGSDSVR